MWTMRFRDQAGYVTRDVGLPEARTSAAAVKTLRAEIHAATEPRGEIVDDESQRTVRAFERTEAGRVMEVRA